MRDTLHKIHRWVGLTLCVPLVLMGLSGSFMVAQHALNIQSYTLAQGKPHTVGEILAAAGKAAPEGFSPSMFRAAEADAPVMVSLTQKEKKGRRIQMLIDPVSLTILDKDASGGLTQKISQFHSTLMLRDYGGRDIVGWFGVAMLMFGISGVVLRWPRQGRWWKAFTMKRKAKGFQLYRDLHGLVGIWGVAVFITVSFSGICLAFPQAMNGAIGRIFLARDLRTSPEIEPAKRKTPMAIDDVIGLAQKAVKDSRLLSVMLPAKPDQPYRVILERVDSGEGTPAISVFIDPWKKKIIEIRDPKDYTPGETIISWQRTLHSGLGWGWPWHILVFTTGLMPLFFSVTGILIWQLRRAKRA